ncbi:VanZ family protein, partial [Streptomyces rochei]|nr:VanZ family protein [Streptomyces rochei]
MQRHGFLGGSAALRIRVTGSVLLVAHLAFVAWYTLRPLDVPWVLPPNLQPFDGIRADLALGWP